MIVQSLMGVWGGVVSGGIQKWPRVYQRREGMQLKIKIQSVALLLIEFCVRHIS